VVTLHGKKLSLVSSILILLAAGLIVASLFYPWWAMKFIAPQYPEGLNIIVYPDKLKGEIDIVNGLNHYIGMSEFSEENFPELKYLKYLIGGLAALTVLTAILRRKAVLYGLIGLFVAGGALGVWDLHRWLKNFGTNLDPKAPIKVDPFIPPIIGENTLANFITYSTLQPGTYFVIAAFVLLLIPLWKDRKQ
jgi:copper chaperone NosL